MEISIANIDKARAHLDWEIQYSLETMCNDALSYDRDIAQ